MKKKLLVFIVFVSMLFPISFSLASFSSGKTTPAVDSSASAIATIPGGLKDFKNLSKAERKSKMKEMKKALREFKEAKKRGDEIDTNTLLLVILSILIPPLAVYLHEGETNNRFWISVLLTILGYLLFGFAGIFFLGSLPGIIYALIVVLGN